MYSCTFPSDLQFEDMHDFLTNNVANQLEELKSSWLNHSQNWKIELSWRSTRYRIVSPDNNFKTLDNVQAIVDAYVERLDKIPKTSKTTIPMDVICHCFDDRATSSISRVAAAGNVQVKPSTLSSSKDQSLSPIDGMSSFF